MVLTLEDRSRYTELLSQFFSTGTPVTTTTIYTAPVLLMFRFRLLRSHRFNSPSVAYFRGIYQMTQLATDNWLLVRRKLLLSTQRCSCCGSMPEKKIDLKVRIHKCSSCSLIRY